MSEIYVLDTETTGLKGCPYDHVVDIGVASLDTDTGEVDTVFSSIVGYNTDEWDPAHKNAWIFNNTDLTLDQVSDAPSQDVVLSYLRPILQGMPVTAYNTGFDFNKFLYNYPWSFRGIFTELPDIMKAATPICKIPGCFADYKWPKLEVAYKMLCPEDPADIHGKQDHRALSDAVVASYVLKALRGLGAYGEA